MCSFDSDLDHYENCRSRIALSELERCLRELAIESRDMLILAGTIDHEWLVEQIEDLHMYAAYLGKPSEKAKQALEARRKNTASAKKKAK